jgi:ATP citrate (pro-S)-lyase
MTIDTIKNSTIKKPIITWAIGTCTKMFATEVWFGHVANSAMETTDAKNNVMREAGFIVPQTFEELPHVLKEMYDRLMANGTVRLVKEHDPPVILMDFKWAQVRFLTLVGGNMVYWFDVGTYCFCLDYFRW